LALAACSASANNDFVGENRRGLKATKGPKSTKAPKTPKITKAPKTTKAPTKP
jgi:hypothetical protein